MCPQPAQKMLSLVEVLPAAYNRNTPLLRLALHWNRPCVLVGVTAERKNWRSPQMSTLPVRIWQDLNHLWPLLHPHGNLASSKAAAIRLLSSAFARTKSETKFWGLLSEKHSHCQEGEVKATMVIDMVCFFGIGVRGGLKIPGRRLLSDLWEIALNKCQAPGQSESESRIKEHRPESWKNDTRGPPVNLGQPILCGEWSLVKRVSSPCSWFLAQSFRILGISWVIGTDFVVSTKWFQAGS